MMTFKQKAMLFNLLVLKFLLRVSAEDEDYEEDCEETGNSFLVDLTLGGFADQEHTIDVDTLA